MITKIAVFKGKKVRKTIHNNEWWFSVIDVVEVLTESERPRKYWNDLKKKLISEGYIEVSEKIGQLKQQHRTEKCVLRIVQIQKQCSALYSLFHHQNPNLLSVGWRVSDMNVSRKLKTPSWRQNGHGLYIKPRVTAMHG